MEESHVIFERSKSIPIRLNDKERELLAILEGALMISEYTDNVDVTNTMFRYRWQSGGEVGKKKNLMQTEIQKMLYFILGLHVSSDKQVGEKLVVDSSLQEHEDYFRAIMEVGRRYKILSPEKMRSTYGKLMHLLQDAVLPGMIKIEIKADIKCVYSTLKEYSAVEFLSEEEIHAATRCIEQGAQEELQTQTEAKSAARKTLINKWKNKMTEETISAIMDSITDSNAYLKANREPVDRMISFLQTYFDPRKAEPGFSLDLRKGKGGAVLSHDHSTQYTFVLQSLYLWREIQDQMFYLWKCADSDILGNSYSLVDTGQGLNRVQGAPKVASAMSKILSKVKSKVGGWVGLSVVHLGDRDVPNALVFIDKYTQVPRILAPIVQTIEKIQELHNNPKTSPFLEEFGTADNVRKTILCDFFKHGFDGSGDDGGSCVDGRLTSAWNWCSKLYKKEYYPIFLMTGFYGFDGSFKN